MKNKNTFCLLFTLFFGLVYCTDDLKSLDEAGSAVFVNMLYRHGDRAPESSTPHGSKAPETSYANDPYKDGSHWPEGWGQLNNEGKLRHYKLGGWIREKYSSLIPSGRYSPEVIYVQSTDIDRTLMSAQANLAGMFPPSQGDSFTSLQWQPIPVHTTPVKSEKILFTPKCPKYDKENKTMFESPQMRNINHQFKELYDYLSKHTGEDIYNMEPIRHLADTLLVEQLYNLTLPEWTKGVFPEKMDPLVKLCFTAPTLTETMKRLKSGPLLKDMIDHMKKKKSGELKHNLWVYSAHETTVANFLNTIGVFRPHRPPYAALVLLELRKNTNNEYFVSVLYKDSDEEPSVLTVPGCTAACPLDKFEEVLRKVIPDDWEKECQSV